MNTFTYTVDTPGIDGDYEVNYILDEFDTVIVDYVRHDEVDCSLDEFLDKAWQWFAPDIDRAYEAVLTELRHAAEHDEKRRGTGMDFEDRTKKDNAVAKFLKARDEWNEKLNQEAIDTAKGVVEILSKFEGPSSAKVAYLMTTLLCISTIAYKEKNGTDIGVIDGLQEWMKDSMKAFSNNARFYKSIDKTVENEVGEDTLLAIKEMLRVK